MVCCAQCKGKMAESLDESTKSLYDAIRLKRTDIVRAILDSAGPSDTARGCMLRACPCSKQRCRSYLVVLGSSPQQGAAGTAMSNLSLRLMRAVNARTHAPKHSLCPFRTVSLVAHSTFEGEQEKEVRD